MESPILSFVFTKLLSSYGYQCRLLSSSEIAKNFPRGVNKFPPRYNFVSIYAVWENPTRRWKKFDDMCIRLDTISQRDARNWCNNIALCMLYMLTRDKTP